MLRQYTPEEYKKMILDFIQINKAAAQALNKEIVWTSDVFGMSREELVNFIIYKICGNPKSIKYVLNQKNKLSLFLDWCVSNGYISSNHLRDEEFDDEAFIFKSIEAMDITVFYDDTVEHLIASLQLNKLFYELLIRGFYEGIRTIDDFIRLKYNDVDFDNRTIYTGGVCKQMSDRFFELLIQYKSCYTWEVCWTRKEFIGDNNKISVQDMNQYKDYIIKIKEIDDLTDELYKSRMAAIIGKYFIRISQYAGYSVSADMLYISGFVNYVKEVCDRENKPVEYYIKLFYVRLNQRGFTRIKNLSDEYGFSAGNTTPLEIRRKCLPYIVRGKYYR